MVGVAHRLLGDPPGLVFMKCASGYARVYRAGVRSQTNTVNVRRGETVASVFAVGLMGWRAVECPQFDQEQRNVLSDITTFSVCE